MMLSTLLLGALAVTSYAQELAHPALTPNLDYLLAGNTKNLPTKKNSYKQWSTNTIPQDCKNAAQDNNLKPADMRTFNVTISDCGDPYVLCRHINSPISTAAFINTFSRMPCHMRDWVRHAVALPGVDSAYNAGGVVVFFQNTASNLDVFLHETGHSLDGQGAMVGFPNGGYSEGAPFKKAYSQDSKVPDDYARTNYVEDFAQNVVVAVYDTVVPNGFPGVQKNWAQIKNQYGAVKRDDNNQIVPGGTCKRRLAPSQPVPTGSKSMRVKREATESPDWEGFFAGEHDIRRPNFKFSTKDTCKAGRKH